MKGTIVLVLLSLLGLAQGLQRLRHRRVSGPDPDPVVLGSSFSGHTQRRDQESNLHKPSFTRCEDYKPEVFEEEPQGKKVIDLLVSLRAFIMIADFCYPAPFLDDIWDPWDTLIHDWKLTPFIESSFNYLPITQCLSPDLVMQKKKNEFNVFPSRRFERLLGHESYSQIALNGNNSTTFVWDKKSVRMCLVWCFKT